MYHILARKQFGRVVGKSPLALFGSEIFRPATHNAHLIGKRRYSMLDICGTNLVIGIYRQYIFAFRLADSMVACSTYTAVRLTEHFHLFMLAGKSLRHTQTVVRTAVIHHDYFYRAVRRCHNALQRLAYIRRCVV